MIGDAETYRTKEEVAEWRKHEPIANLRTHLAGKYNLTDADFQQVTERVNRQIDEAVQFAKDSPTPAPGEVMTDVWA
jgi:pyruvate dehydrogenase E1 component alpha subunit